MNIREKVGKLFTVGFDGLEAPDSLKRLIDENFVGGVILFKRNIKDREQLWKLNDSIKKISGHDRILISIDYEGGRVFRLPVESGFTKWPPLAHFGEVCRKTGSDREVYEMGIKMAEELKSVNIDINFAPVLDVNTNIKNPVIGDRAFSNDPMLVAALGKTFINAIQSRGIVACGKHFPGHGDTAEDSHTDLPRLPHTLGRLEQIELVPFQAAIDAGVKSIMTAHVVYEGIDPHLPATLSPKIVDDLLRRRLSYHGVIFSDDLNMSAVSHYGTVPETSVKAIQAGCDNVLICRNPEIQIKAIEEVVSAVESGKISEERIERSCFRVAGLIK